MGRITKEQEQTNRFLAELAKANGVLLDGEVKRSDIFTTPGKGLGSSVLLVEQQRLAIAQLTGRAPASEDQANELLNGRRPVTPAQAAEILQGSKH